MCCVALEECSLVRRASPRELFAVRAGEDSRVPKCLWADERRAILGHKAGGLWMFDAEPGGGGGGVARASRQDP